MREPLSAETRGKRPEGREKTALLGIPSRESSDHQETEGRKKIEHSLN